MQRLLLASLTSFLLGGMACGDNISATNSDSGVPDGPGSDSTDDGTPADTSDDTAPPVTETILISEVTLSNNSQEYIEIYNPTSQTVALDHYYLCDDDEYPLLPGAFGNGPRPTMLNNTSDPTMQFDFLLRFPDNATIGPGQVVIVATRFNDFNTANPARSADFGILQAPAGKDMVDPGGGMFVGRGGNAQFSVGGEMVALFLWDGTSDLVKDIDLVNVGMNNQSFNQIPDKSNTMVDGPDADTTPTRYAMDRVTLSLMDGVAPTGQSHKRIALEGTNEVKDGAGNGLTGHDETSEDISMTWDRAGTYTAPTPGAVPVTLLP